MSTDASAALPNGIRKAPGSNFHCSRCNADWNESVDGLCSNCGATTINKKPTMKESLGMKTASEPKPIRPAPKLRGASNPHDPVMVKSMIEKRRKDGSGDEEIAASIQSWYGLSKEDSWKYLKETPRHESRGRVGGYAPAPKRATPEMEMKASTDPDGFLKKSSLDDASAEYKEAHRAFTEASKKFTKVQNDYRSRKIGDDEYLAAREEWKAADAALDRAQAEEERREGVMKASTPQEGLAEDDADAAKPIFCVRWTIIDKRTGRGEKFKTGLMTLDEAERRAAGEEQKHPGRDIEILKNGSPVSFKSRSLKAATYDDDGPEGFGPGRWWDSNDPSERAEMLDGLGSKLPGSDRIEVDCDWAQLPAGVRQKITAAMGQMKAASEPKPIRPAPKLRGAATA